MLAIELGRRRFLSAATMPPGTDRRALAADPRPDRARCSSSPTTSATIAAAVRRPRELAVPRPRVQLPGRPGRRPEAQGNQLHPRRGHAGGRDEARPHRPDRRGHAGGLHRHRAASSTTRSSATSRRSAARGGKVIAVATEGDERHRRATPTTSSTCPTCPEPLQPMLTVVPLQLLAYHAAVAPRLQRGQAAQPGQERDGGVRFDC